MNQVETAKYLAASVWKCSPNDVYIEDVTEYYSWARSHTVMTAIDSERRSLLATFNPDGDPLLFHNLAGIAANLESLNRLLQTEQIKLPTGIPAEQLAEALRNFLVNIGGFVGSQDFWEQQKDSMDIWTSRMPHGGKELFKNHCQNPSIHRHDDEWRLEFSYFNNQGGVERWRVSGDRQAVREAAFETTVPDRTFLFPYGG